MGGKKCPVSETCGNNSKTGLSDEDFFMDMACLAAFRSKDPKRQVNGLNYNTVMSWINFMNMNNNNYNNNIVL